jgi:hypothetical protein
VRARAMSNGLGDAEEQNEMFLAELDACLDADNPGDALIQLVVSQEVERTSAATARADIIHQEYHELGVQWFFLEMIRTSFSSRLNDAIMASLALDDSTANDSTATATTSGADSNVLAVTFPEEGPLGIVFVELDGEILVGDVRHGGEAFQFVRRGLRKGAVLRSIGQTSVHQLHGKVRQTPGWPRSWANFSLLLLCFHRNVWANLHLLGRPNAFLAQGHDAGRRPQRRQVRAAAPRDDLRDQQQGQRPLALEGPRWRAGAPAGPAAGEKDAELAQILGQLQPFRTVSPPGKRGPTRSFWADLTPRSLAALPGPETGVFSV